MSILFEGFVFANERHPESGRAVFFTRNEGERLQPGEIRGIRRIRRDCSQNALLTLRNDPLNLLPTVTPKVLLTLRNDPDSEPKSDALSAPRP